MVYGNVVFGHGVVNSDVCLCYDGCCYGAFDGFAECGYIGVLWESYDEDGYVGVRFGEVCVYLGGYA